MLNFQSVMVRMEFQDKIARDHIQDLFNNHSQYAMEKMESQDKTVLDLIQVFLNHTQFATVWMVIQVRTVFIKTEPKLHLLLKFQPILKLARCSQLATNLSLKTVNQFALRPKLLAAPKPALESHHQETDLRVNTLTKVRDSELNSLDYII